MEKLLFDCGVGCLSELPVSDILATDHLFFSHLHMDHVGGFDIFFRCNFNRVARPNHVWGPPETARIMQHRFQGFLWNLNSDSSASWFVSDIHQGQIHTTRFELGEAFEVAHDAGMRPYRRTVLENEDLRVEALTMDHRTPTLAYIVHEQTRWNIDKSRLASLGLRSGPWLKELKEPSGSHDTAVIEGINRSMDELRRCLIVETPGESIAYLTDFQLDESAMERLSDALNGCRTVICESRYRHADLELAGKNFHMTSVLSATLARQAGVDEMVLIHLSDRYGRGEWVEMLREARQIFPNTHYPRHWGLETEPNSVHIKEMVNGEGFV
jgi:ribonuclease Z